MRVENSKIKQHNSHNQSHMVKVTHYLNATHVLTAHVDRTAYMPFSTHVYLHVF